MTTHPNSYADQGEQDFRDELLAEIQSLDWEKGNAIPIREAAQLIYVVGNEADHEDDADMHRDLANFLMEVPVDYRIEVIANVPQDLREEMLDQMPQHVRDMVHLLDGQNLPHQETGESDNRYGPEPILEWERQKVQHALNYVEDACGQDAVHHIESVIDGSRDMTLRDMPGYPGMYENDATDRTHRRYLQCISNMPASVEAKLNAHPGGQGPEEFKEAVQHEVNRMAYRLNLEIQDRLLTQYSRKAKLHDAAREQGMDQDTLDRLLDYGERRAAYADQCRHQESPTARMIEQESRACLTDMGLEKAISENNTDTLNEIMEATRNLNGYREREQCIRDYLGKEATEPISEAFEIASQWTDEMILDGGMDFHFRYADLLHVPSNGAREDWMLANDLIETRDQFAGDCVTRALNEVTGGENYGRIWEEITRRGKTGYQPVDADFGSFEHQYEKVYEKHGLHKVLETMEDPMNPMGHHLDLREIPSILEGLTDQDGNQVSFIASTRLHNIAVVEGQVRDIWDSTEMGDRTIHQEDGRLSHLWLKCDEETAGAVREILDRYRKARTFDDVLTPGVRWRTGN